MSTYDRQRIAARITSQRLSPYLGATSGSLEDAIGLYDWWCERADESLAEYAMSCLSPVPLPDLATKEDVRVVKEEVRATKEDVRAVKEDVRAVKEDVRAVKDELRDVKNDVARVDAKVDALAVRMDERFDRVIELREVDRKESGRRAWKIALALPVEVVVLLAGAAAVLEWLRG